MRQTADLVVIAIYLFVTLAVCLAVTRVAPDADELFLAGRSLGPLAIGLSLFASNISSTTLIGLPGAAYAHGISVANYEWMAALVLVFSAVFVLPAFIRARLTTVPELLEQRFDGRLRRYLSGTSLFLSLALDTAGSLYAGGLILSQLFPGLSLAAACGGLALFAGLYMAAGGLRAVVYTDVLQAVVLLVGAAVMSFVVFGQFEHDWGRLVEPERLSLLRPMDDPVLPWLGTLVGLPVLGFYYWIMNQYVAQRLLGAQSARGRAGSAACRDAEVAAAFPDGDARRYGRGISAWPGSARYRIRAADQRFRAAASSGSVAAPDGEAGARRHARVRAAGGAPAALRALLSGHAVSAMAFVASAAGLFELHSQLSLA